MWVAICALGDLVVLLDAVGGGPGTYVVGLDSRLLQSMLSRLVFQHPETDSSSLLARME